MAADRPGVLLHLRPEAQSSEQGLIGITRDPIAVPDQRRADIARLAAELRPGQKVALSTHINSDGDGCGSEAALAGLLGQMAITAHVVNPTPWPAMYAFLLGGDVRDRSAEGVSALAGIDRLIVVDISDVKRLGSLAPAVRALKMPPLVIDHHLPGEEPPGTINVTDVGACATGELVYDFAATLGLEITPAIATALYVAILTDTGGFRFSNTSPRCHAIAARLLSTGVDPEEMYRRIYASVPKGRLRLLRDALDSLEVDDAKGLAWVSIAAGALEKYDVSGEDLDGIAEYPRSVSGVRLALAKQFGGGGHARASGALVAGTMDEVRGKVIAAAREML